MPCFFAMPHAASSLSNLLAIHEADVERKLDVLLCEAHEEGNDLGW